MRLADTSEPLDFYALKVQLMTTDYLARFAPARRAFDSELRGGSAWIGDVPVGGNLAIPPRINSGQRR